MKNLIIEKDAVHTLAEIADILRISKRHLAKLLAEGKGPPTIRLGRRALVRRSALDQFLTEVEGHGHDRAA